MYIEDFSNRLKKELPEQLPPTEHFSQWTYPHSYCNIPVEEDICSVVKILKDHVDDIDTLGLEQSDIQHLLEFVLNSGYCRFGEIYQQRMGVAMGNRLAPPFVILFMHQLESSFLASLPAKPSMRVRYIDDIFGVWLHQGLIQDF